ncbi:MAG: tetratricopeptide repeat protein [Alphaproteobacteria bacterium]
MPVLFILTVIVQILFAWHVHRTGRNMNWIFLILMLPGMGCLIYFLVEVLPEVVRGPVGHKAQRKFRLWRDPDKEFRETKYAFDTAPTIANRIKLAQLLTAQRNYDAVIALLEPALADHFKDDVLLLEGLAYAYYDKGDYKNTLAYIQKIYDRDDGSAPQDYIKLLRARAYIGLGELETAKAHLLHLTLTFTGEEARIALAQLHERMGEAAEARAVYQDIVTRSKHSPAHYQRYEREWIEMAKKKLEKA